MNPDIKAMFYRLNDEHFDGEVPDIPVVWNTRMTTTAGYCRYRREGAVACGYSSARFNLEPYQIDLSVQLFRNEDFDLEKIERTLTHEMVHAYLVHKYNEKGHTRRFQSMMREITGEYKNHRCHSYNTAGLKRREAKNVRWYCERCGFEGRKARMPRTGRTYNHNGCGGVVQFEDLRKKGGVKIF